MRASPALLLCVIACGPGEAQIGETSTVPGTSTTTEPLPSTIVNADWILSGVLEIDANATMPEGDVWMVMTSFDGELWGDEYRSINLGPVQAGDAITYQFGLDEIPDDSWYTADIDEPGIELAGFSVGAYVDTNGDGEAGPGDHFVASQLDFVGHLRGGVTQDAVAAGAALGWNVVTVLDALGEVAVTPFSGDLANYDVSGNLLPAPRNGALGGVIRPVLSEGPEGQRRVDVYSVNGLMGLPTPANATLMSTAVDRGPTNQDFRFEDITPDPPEDHFATDFGDGPEPGIEYAVYSIFAYVDINEDGGWQFTDGEVLASTDAVSPEIPTTLLYARATGWEAAGPAFILGGMGWQLYKGLEEDVELLPWSTGLFLDNRPS